MPRNGVGVYTLPGSNFVNGEVIDATEMNDKLLDMAQALTDSLDKDGQTEPTANLQMGGFRLTDLGAGISQTDAATISQVGSYGDLKATAAAAAPSRWLFCYGQAISRTTYAALFTAIGVAWGVGDGSTTFNVPDLRGRTLFGKDNMGGAAASRVTSAGSGIAGSTLGTVGGNQLMQTHTHNYGFVVTGAAGSDVRVPVDAFDNLGQITSTGGGASQNMPPAAIVNWLIYAGV